MSNHCLQPADQKAAVFFSLFDLSVDRLDVRHATGVGLPPSVTALAPGGEEEVVGGAKRP